MPGQEMASQPLTPGQKRYRRRYTLVSLATAVPIFAAAYFVVSPLMPEGPRRIDDVLAVAAAFILLHMVVAHMYWFAPKYAVISRQGQLAQYFIVATALMIYAAGERLGLLGGVTAWGTLAFATLVGIPAPIGPSTAAA